MPKHAQKIRFFGNNSTLTEINIIDINTKKTEYFGKYILRQPFDEPDRKRYYY